MAAAIVFASAIPALASYDDTGPLADVLAIRAAYGPTMRTYIFDVIVRGDWAQVGMSGKGARVVNVRRIDGMWSTREFETVPPDAKYFFERVRARAIEAEKANFKPTVRGQQASTYASIAANEPKAAGSLVPSRDAYGAKDDVARFCRVLDDLTEGVEPDMAHAIRHVVIDGDYAIATVRIAFDSFNVLSERHGSTWSQPYSVGPDYPSPAAFTSLGVPAATGRRIFEDLQALNTIPPNLRKDPCR